MKIRAANHPRLNKLNIRLLGLLIIAAMLPGPVFADTAGVGLSQRLGLVELVDTFDEAKVRRCLPQSQAVDNWRDLRERAMLNCLGLQGSDAHIISLWTSHPVFSVLSDPGEPGWLVQDRANIRAFEDRLAEAMAAGLSTGYNIVPHELWPQFDATRTVIYGHSDWRHARQLVALLHTELLYPRVIPLVKKSAFLFREGWGEPSQPLKHLSNGQRVIDQVEFDLFLEFAHAEDVERFAQLVTRYAKKDSADEAGLIYGAWWQPFYRTLYPRPGAHELTVMLLSFRGYRTNLMGLPEQAPDRIKVMRSLEPEWAVSTYSIWVNPGFYRNQFGEYK